MERLEKNAYQEKLVRGLLNSLRENKTISDVHVKNLISEVHSEIGRSLDKALIKRKADELLFTWMNSELNIVKKEMKGKRTPLVIKLKNEEAMNDEEFEIFTEKILEKVLVKESGRVRKEPEIKEEPEEKTTPSKKRNKEERIRINTLDKIIDAQVAEGFFKECPITFKDIALVKALFKEKLKTMYHTRISYPELKK